MKKEIVTLKDLFLEQGRELYNASLQEKKILPEIKKKVNNQELRNLINRQLESAKDQNSRLDRVFQNLDQSPEGEKDECCQSVLSKTKEFIERSTKPEIRDAAIINTIQRLNHNKMAGFGSLISYASEIGEQGIADDLQTSLSDEREIDQALSRIAEGGINKRALQGATFAV